MSWSYIYDTKVDLADDTPASVVGTPSREVVDTLRQAALDLIATGLFGDKDAYDFRINLNGHENPGHVPADGYANDCCQIAITQTTRVNQEQG